MIRHATDADVPRLVEMAHAFVQSTPYRDRVAVDPICVERLARGMLAHDRMAGFVVERHGHVVGMLGLHAYEHPMSGRTVVSETVWWVDPQYRGIDGLRLLRAGEQWARDQQATVLYMVAPSEEIERLYTKLGFARLEAIYERRLVHGVGD